MISACFGMSVPNRHAYINLITRLLATLTNSIFECNTLLKKYFSPSVRLSPALCLHLFLVAQPYFEYFPSLFGAI